MLVNHKPLFFHQIPKSHNLLWSNFHNLTEYCTRIMINWLRLSKWLIKWFLFLKLIICKHMTNFPDKTSLPLLLVDNIYIGSLVGKNFKKWVEGSETSKAKSFISLCNTFFFICFTKWNIHDKNKETKYFIYDWVNVF